jgi:ATP-binding cassette subfamily F protein 3
MLEKAERTAVPDEEVEWGFRFPHLSPAPRFVLRLQDVVKSYGPRKVLEGVNLVIERGDRVALVGPNGCGKSTLLRIASAILAADDGDVRIGDGVLTRYFAQHVTETLTPGRTVLEEIQETAPSRRQGELRSLLGIFQFSGDDVFKRVEALSGGEKNRLALARLALDPGHFLLLDEPTNHLDLAAREALEEALNEYEGTVLLVSHDRYFINRVASRVAGFDSGRLYVFEGDYDTFAAETARRMETAAAAAPSTSGVPSGALKREERRLAAVSRNERNRILRALRKNVASLEEEIGRSERRLQEIADVLTDPATYKNQGLAESLGREQKSIQGELSDLIARWEKTSAELQSAES